MVTLHLPSPDDQLLLEVDAAKNGLGHVLYAINDGKKKIVRLHSTKLDSRCQNWHPCEIEALAFATGIEKEQDIIRESKHPLVIMPDSKPVHEAVKRINQGKFSTSARMSSFLNNVNRFRIQSKHVSGKAKLNPIADIQSRIPAECNSELCSIHKFIEQQWSAHALPCRHHQKSKTKYTYHKRPLFILPGCNLRQLGKSSGLTRWTNCTNNRNQETVANLYKRG